MEPAPQIDGEKVLRRIGLILAPFVLGTIISALALTQDLTKVIIGAPGLAVAWIYFPKESMSASFFVPLYLAVNGLVWGAVLGVIFWIAIQE